MVVRILIKRKRLIQKNISQVRSRKLIGANSLKYLQSKLIKIKIIQSETPKKECMIKNYGVEVPEIMRIIDANLYCLKNRRKNLSLKRTQRSLYHRNCAVQRSISTIKAYNLIGTKKEMDNL